MTGWVDGWMNLLHGIKSNSSGGDDHLQHDLKFCRLGDYISF